MLTISTDMVGSSITNTKMIKNHTRLDVLVLCDIVTGVKGD